MSDVNLKRKVTLKRKGEVPVQAPESKNPNKFIWIAILGLVAICSIYGLNQLNKKNTKKGGAEDKDNVVSEVVNNSSNTTDSQLDSTNNDEINSTVDNSTSDEKNVFNTITETNSTTSVENAVTSKSNSTREANVAKDAVSNNTPSNKGNQSSEVSVKGSVEEKAKQVIRGDFGNGTERKIALGTEYELIQAKVNNIYKLGN